MLDALNVLRFTIPGKHLSMLGIHIAKKAK
uniref:Uncharacterized protein n=1 Tax=Anguilla anguilla TaxID=7936 RepID=A0A0E9TZK5_ANGAN